MPFSPPPRPSDVAHPHPPQPAPSETIDHPLLDPAQSAAAAAADPPPPPIPGPSSPSAGPSNQVFFDAGQSFDSYDRPYDGRALPAAESSSAAFDALSPPPPPRSRLDTVRLAIGRFGRLVGMRVPGAVYTSVSQADQDAHPRRRILGSGLGQDGVFSNMNAKPERRRRRQPNVGMEGDRGEDDDLADEEEVPPSYAQAAADAVPPYWETTMVGGLSHPLAPGGNGWTPGSPTVGAVEDLIIEGLPVGNLFGLIWNLLVSVSFQFVGFLLTYLLHTTHAAKAGSRIGLGITLVQYGLSLHASAEKIRTDPPPGSGGTDEPKGPKGPKGPQEDMSSADWLSLCLIALGGLIMILSTVSYIKLWRFGHQLVRDARRDEADTEAALATEADTLPPDSASAPEPALAPEVSHNALSLFQAIMQRAQAQRIARTRQQDGERWAVPARVFQLDDLEESHSRS